MLDIFFYWAVCFLLGLISEQYFLDGNNDYLFRAQRDAAWFLANWRLELFLLAGTLDIVKGILISFIGKYYFGSNILAQSGIVAALLGMSFFNRFSLPKGIFFSGIGYAVGMLFVLHLPGFKLFLACWLSSFLISKKLKFSGTLAIVILPISLVITKASADLIITSLIFVVLILNQMHLPVRKTYF